MTLHCIQSDDVEYIRTCIVFQWYTWSQLFGVGDHQNDSTGGAYIIKYFVYVLWACFFGFMSAMFVRMFAPYACGSGIPEVCITFDKLL